MKISKAKYHGQPTFNDYDVEMSWGQLTAIRNALAADHSDPVSDELYAEISFYLDQLPGPGEDEETLKAEEEATASGMASPEAAQKPLNPRADDLLPAPGEEEGGATGEEGQPPGTEGEEGGAPPEGAPGEQGPPPGEGEQGEQGPPPGTEGGEETEADRRLPPPPRE